MHIPTPEDAAILGRLTTHVRKIVMEEVTNAIPPIKLPPLFSQQGTVYRSFTHSVLRWRIWQRLYLDPNPSGRTMSTVRIGQIFGIDHTSVLHGMRRINGSDFDTRTSPRLERAICRREKTLASRNSVPNTPRTRGRSVRGGSSTVC